MRRSLLLRLRRGQLDRIPDELKYTIIRGLQIRDLLHVITGCTPAPLDELVLQASCPRWTPLASG